MTAEERRLRKNLKDRLRYAKRRGYIIPDNFEERINNADEQELRELTENWRDEVEYVNFVDPNTGEVKKLTISEYEDVQKVYKAIEEHPTLLNAQALAGRNAVRMIEKRLSINILPITDNLLYEASHSSLKWLRSEKADASSKIKALMQIRINEVGYDELGLRLQADATRLIEVLEGLQVASSQDEINIAVNEAFEIFMGRPLTHDEQVEIELMSYDEQMEIPY